MLSDDLLSHGLSHTTIGAGAFHFRVRDGIGWDHAAVIAERSVLVAQLRGLGMGLGRNKVNSHERCPLRYQFSLLFLKVPTWTVGACAGMHITSLSECSKKLRVI